MIFISLLITYLLIGAVVSFMIIRDENVVVLTYMDVLAMFLFWPLFFCVV